MISLDRWQQVSFCATRMAQELAARSTPSPSRTTVAMFGARASRILNPSTSRPTRGTGAASSSTSGAATAQLSPQQRIARWKIVTLRILWVFMALRVKTSCSAALGKNNYLRLIGAAKEQEKKDEEKGKKRVIYGWVLGKKLPPGKGPVEVDPEVCDHPTSHMKPRSNLHRKADGDVGGKQWFTCLKCQSRWERTPLQAEEEPPEGKDWSLMGFGRWRDLTYQEVLEQHPDYAEWCELIVETEEASAQMEKFVRWKVSKLKQEKEPEAEGEDNPIPSDSEVFSEWVDEDEDIP